VTLDTFVVMFWPMTMAGIANGDNNTTDSNVIGKVFSSYDDGVKVVEECAK